MKKLLLLAMMSIILMSCGKTYIETMDVDDGEFIMVRDSKHNTILGDTLIVSTELNSAASYTLYGRYVGKVPNNFTYTKNSGEEVRIIYAKVIRIR